MKLRTIFGKNIVYVGLLICHYICFSYLVHLFLCYLTSRPRCSLALEFICISFRRLISLSLIYSVFIDLYHSPFTFALLLFCHLHSFSIQVYSFIPSPHLTLLVLLHYYIITKAHLISPHLLFSLLVYIMNWVPSL